jgi:hypothetical protein
MQHSNNYTASVPLSLPIVIRCLHLTSLPIASHFWRRLFRQSMQISPEAGSVDSGFCRECSECFVNTFWGEPLGVLNKSKAKGFSAPQMALSFSTNNSFDPSSARGARVPAAAAVFLIVSQA